MLIVTPGSDVELDQVRDLMRAFVVWHRERHPDDVHLIERYFDATAFEEELGCLPGDYAPPGGALLLAKCDGSPAGCVALRRIDAVSCEMKRMFVYREFHGKGVGRALAEAVIDRARALGYQSIVLDTSIRQVEAQGLYRRYGFRYVAPYYEVPADLQNWLVFMQLDLGA